MALLAAAILLCACLLDRLVGEPRRWHPLVGFGWLAANLERRLNRQERKSAPVQRLLGLSAVVLLVGPFILLAFWIQWRLLSSGILGMLAYGLIAAGVLYWALGWRSLVLHLQSIATAFKRDDIEQARVRVGRIVSRDCRTGQWPDLRRAAIESALENTSDAIVGPLFWFLLAGLPGAVLYRLSNTLDALWGYRNARYRYFGWAAARWDDLLNLLPARLTALLFVLGAPVVRAPRGSAVSALQAWRTQAGGCASPNAGPVMCAGAGALGVRLGGPAVYHGAVILKPWMGGSREPDSEDLARTLTLIRVSLLWFLVPAVAVLSLVGVSGMFYE